MCLIDIFWPYKQKADYMVESMICREHYLAISKIVELIYDVGDSNLVLPV